MSREATDQLYIELGYFTPEEYYVYTAEAVAAVNSNFSLACSAESGALQEASADLSSAASIVAVASVTKETSSSVNSNFAVVSTVGKIVESSANFGSLFTPNIVADVQIAGDALLEAVTNLLNTASKFAGAQSTLDNIINLSLQNDRIREESSALSASFEGITDAARLRDSAVSLAASSSLAVDISVLKEAISLEAGSFTLTIDVQNVQEAAASLASTVAVSATAIEFIPKVYPNNRPATLEFWHDAATDSFLDLQEWEGSAFALLNRSGFSTSIKNEGTASFFQTKYATTGFRSTHSDVDIAANQNFIFEVDVYITNISATSGLLVASTANVNAWSTTLTQGFTLQSFNASGSMRMRALIANPANSSAPYDILGSNGSYLTENAWNRITLRRINGNTIQLLKNGTVYGSVTYSGVITLNGFSYLKNSALSSTSDQIYFDHWRFRVGDTELSDGTTIFEPVNTYFRHRFDEDFSDSLGGYLRLDAQTMASSASITAVPNATFDGITIHQSLGTMTADAGAIYANSAALASEFAQTVVAEEVPIEFSADLVATSTVSADVYRIQEGSAALSSEFAQATDGYRTLEFAVQTDAIFIELAAVARIGAGLINAESSFNLTADVSRNVGITADITSLAQISASVYRTQEGAATISSQFAETVAAVKTTDSISTQSSAFAITASADRTRDTVAALASEVTIEADVSGGFVGVDASLTVTATQDITYTRIRHADSSASSTASISVTADRFAEMPAALASSTDLNIDYTRTRDTSVQTDAIFSEMAVVAKTGAGFITLDSAATVTAAVNVIQGQSATLNASTALTATAVATRLFDSALSVNASLSAEGTTNIVGEGQLVSAFSISADGDVTGVGSSALISVGTLVVVAPDRIRSADSAVTSSAIQSAAVGAIRSTGAITTVTTGLTAEVTSLVDSGPLNFGALFTPAVTYRVLRVDQYVYTVPRERRTYNIHRESRSHTVQREQRNYTIRG